MMTPLSAYKTCLSHLPPFSWTLFLYKHITHWYCFPSSAESLFRQQRTIKTPHLFLLLFLSFTNPTSLFFSDYFYPSLLFLPGCTKSPISQQHSYPQKLTVKNQSYPTRKPSTISSQVCGFQIIPRKFEWWISMSVGLDASRKILWSWSVLSRFLSLP